MLIIATAMIATSVTAQMPARPAKPKFDRQHTQTDIKPQERMTLKHRGMTPSNAVRQEAPTKAVANAPEMGSTVISAQPEGTLKSYKRAGTSFVYYYGSIYMASQEGTTIDIVTAPDGQTVYLKDIVTYSDTETWVMGTIEGNKIHVPLYQCIDYVYDYDFGVAIARSVVMTVESDVSGTSITYIADLDATEMTYTISADGSTISLDGTDEMTPGGNPQVIMSLIYTDNYEWANYGDFQSVYTEIDDVASTMPEGVDVETWGYRYNDGYNNYGTLMDVAVDGDKLYIRGVSEDNPESVIEGTISGDKVSFKSDQYLGSASGYMLYFCGSKATEVEVWDDIYGEYFTEHTYTYTPELVMDYDAVNKRLTSADDDVIMVNIGKGADDISFWSVGINPRLEYFEEVAATPATPKVLDVEGSSYDMLLNLEVKTEDTAGKFITPEKLCYKLWVKEDGEPREFVFNANDYYSFSASGIEELVEIPYGFTAYDYSGYDDISFGGAYIYLYQTGFDDYGVQSVYYGAGERRESEIGWYNNGAGVGNISTDSGDAVAVAFYGIDGRKLTTPQKGINIVEMSDGSVRKVLVK